MFDRAMIIIEYLHLKFPQKTEQAVDWCLKRFDHFIQKGKVK